MLHREIRISNGKDYNNIYKHGKKITGRYIIVFFTSNNRNINRFGFVASKKIGNAVIRNKYKRKLRAIVGQGDFKQTGYDFVIIAKKNITDAEFEDIQKDFNKVFKKAGLC